ncbi:MAG: aromatic ring-hydroxylating dioxygenase subunit alpha [Acidobacteriota bacterium]|nr:aromatic ring-hydroxylating dioxygenase subunit alpha [Acidobacteriota bacterium]
MTSESSGKGQMLRGFWYPVTLSAQVRKGKLRRAMLLGLPLAIGRDATGRPFAMRDACPHRGMPLTCGRVDGQLLECSYHGWRFDVHSGQCREIPSWVEGDRLKVDRIYAAHYPCEDQDGYIWVYIPQKEAVEEEAPPAPRLPVFSDNYRITRLSADLPVHVDHGIIGLMDPAHGPFVHQSWWWRGRHSIRLKEKTFEPVPNGFRIRAHKPSSNSGAYKLLGVYGQPVTTTIEFVLPNMRFEQIHCGGKWFSSRATVTPITMNLCRLDFCAAWNVFRYIPFVTPVFRIFARTFIGQDTRTMERQAEGLRHDPSLMLIDDADRPAKWYYQLKQALIDSRLTGEPMKHPISEPVTLRWRS